jgi:hypothetical protein
MKLYLHSFPSLQGEIWHKDHFTFSPKVLTSSWHRTCKPAQRSIAEKQTEIRNLYSMNQLCVYKDIYINTHINIFHQPWIFQLEKI